MPKPLHLIQGDDERPPKQRDLAHYCPDSALRHIDRFFSLRQVEGQAGTGAGRGKVHLKHARLVPLIQ